MLFFLFAIALFALAAERPGIALFALLAMPLVS